MGRFGSELATFIKEALDNGKYQSTLICIDRKTYTFELSLPRISKSTIGTKSVEILKDWNFKKGRKLKSVSDYSKAKQGLKAALNKKPSRYFEIKTLCNYRIRADEEVKVLMKRKSKCPIKSPLSVSSSGYGSANSPLNVGPHTLSDYDELVSKAFDSGEDKSSKLLTDKALQQLAAYSSSAECEKTWNEIAYAMDLIAPPNPYDKPMISAIDVPEMQHNTLVASTERDPYVEFEKSWEENVLLDPYNFDDPMISAVHLLETVPNTLASSAEYDPRAEFEKLWDENVSFNKFSDPLDNPEIAVNSEMVKLKEFNKEY